MDVTITLRNHQHWRWVTNDEKATNQSRWTMMMNGEMMSWLKRQRIEFTKTRDKEWSDRFKRPVWVVRLHFKDRKQAIHFALQWL